MSVSLPDAVAAHEKLARIVCASSRPRKYQKNAFRFNVAEQRYIVVAKQFIDGRPPSYGKELSVNRISTLSLDEAHALGVAHRHARQPALTYHGFAEITAQTCFENDCRVTKDDMGGTQPYHANIIYPYPQKEDSQEVAAKLAHLAELKRFEP